MSPFSALIESTKGRHFQSHACHPVWAASLLNSGPCRHKGSSWHIISRHLVHSTLKKRALIV